jgi:hypothetical protein
MDTGWYWMLVQPGSRCGMWDGFGEGEESQRSDEIKRLVVFIFRNGWGACPCGWPKERGQRCTTGSWPSTASHQTQFASDAHPHTLRAQSCNQPPNTQQRTPPRQKRHQPIHADTAAAAHTTTTKVLVRVAPAQLYVVASTLDTTVPSLHVAPQAKRCQRMHGR